VIADGYYWLRLDDHSFIAQHRDGGWYMVGLKGRTDLSAAAVLRAVAPPRGLRYWKVPQDGEGWSPWIQPVMVPRSYQLACCDCGSVHSVEFKVEDESVTMRLRRNNRATGQVRRRMARVGGFNARLVDAVGRTPCIPS